MSEVEPALTAEEWADGYNSEDLHIRLRSSSGTPGPRVGVDVMPKAYPLGGTLGDERDIHALAAFCLAGQPFGFTHADRILLNVLAATDAGWWVRDELKSLTDRIVALLPPQEPPQEPE